MKTLTIDVEGLVVAAELDECPTAQAIWDALPIEGNANTWGDEIYFEIPVHLSRAADARAEVEVGELGYWAPGQAFCVFFGVTPASVDGKPRAASPVNVFGRVRDDVTILRSVRNGARVRLTRTV